MNGFVVVTEGEGEQAAKRGINPMLITHFDTRPQGGALLQTMGGKTIELNKVQWESIAKIFVGADEPEPPAAAK